MRYVVSIQYVSFVVYIVIIAYLFQAFWDFCFLFLVGALQLCYANGGLVELTMYYHSFL